MSGRFKAIFCRNVAIYFEESAQEQLWERFAPKLYAGGVLYLGHSERITGPACALFEAGGISTYRLRRERQ
jgi:chemotaxis protein methyltransferase CheR